MIRIRFTAVNGIQDDVCEILEHDLTNHIEIEDWISESLPSLEFDCMDYPYDLGYVYDCYFKSRNEETEAGNVYYVLAEALKSIKQVEFSVYIVDNKLNPVKEISI